MRSESRVTVTTVFLNAERFLEEAIESVFAQTCDEWALLLVDDGSEDRSSEIARRYSRKFAQKVRYLEHPNHENRGISASHNLAIKEASGEYIAFLDSDDVWLPEKLERQVSILDDHPEAMMVCGQTQYWYSWTGAAEDAQRDLLIDPGIKPDSLVEPPLLLIRFLLQEAPIPCPSDVMLRRATALAVGGFEESFRRIFTDQVFYAKLCLQFPVFVAGQNWSRYRKHSESAVALAKKKGELRSARLSYLKWMSNYLNECPAGNREIRRALKRARRSCKYPGLSSRRRDIRYRSSIAEESFRSLVRQALPAPVLRWLRTQYPR